jgi:hypothetical protein
MPVKYLAPKETETMYRRFDFSSEITMVKKKNLNVCSAHSYTHGPGLSQFDPLLPIGPLACWSYLLLAV